MAEQDQAEEHIEAGNQALDAGDVAAAREALEKARRHAPDHRDVALLEIEVLEADPSKAKRELGWEPRVSFEQLTAMMLQADLIMAGVDVSGFARLRELAAG